MSTFHILYCQYFLDQYLLEVFHRIHVTLPRLIIEGILLEYWYLDLVGRISLQERRGVGPLSLYSDHVEYFKLKALLGAQTEMRVELE